MPADMSMRDDDGKSGEDWVLLTSTDGFSFMIKRKVALTSGTLKEYAQHRELVQGVPGRQMRAERTVIYGVVVEKLCEFMSHKATYEHAGPKEDVPEFTERIVPDVALELLVAADYLEV